MSLQEVSAELHAQHLAHKERRAKWAAKAVPDDGIDLRRRFKIVPAVIEIPLPPAPILKSGRHNRGWPAVQTEPAYSVMARQVSVGAILQTVARSFDISVADLISDRRTQKLVVPRQIAMWLAKKLTTKSLVFIGKRMNGKDHTSVLHGVRKIERLRQSNPELQHQLDQFVSALRPHSPENDNADLPNAAGL